MPMIVHHVVFSYKRGVYLGHTKTGKAMWSKDEGRTGRETAPTFDDQVDLDRHLNYLKITKEDWPTDAELREVHPTGNDEHATIEDCANVGLPRWGEQGLGT